MARGWDEHDGGFLIGTHRYQECGDGCCWNREECEECQGTGLERIETKQTAGIEETVK